MVGRMKNRIGWMRRPFLTCGFLLAATAVLAEPRNLSALKQEIITYVDSGDYGRELETVVARAMKWIQERAAQRVPGERPTLVLDIDETALSNLPQMLANDFGYTPPVWDAWVARGEAPAIGPVLALYRAARQAGVEMIFISGRRERDRPGTEKNLRAAGYADYAALLLKPDATKDTTEKFKTDTRRKLVAAGRVIIANVGDQESDLAGGFAERAFKLPAPFYITQ